CLKNIQLDLQKKTSRRMAMTVRSKNYKSSSGFKFLTMHFYGPSPVFITKCLYFNQARRFCSSRYATFLCEK
ncbi:hypothetical protein ACH8I4_02825, partial [Acinetobacter sp. ABJ_C3_5]|uniref:hypothetical protein n=1 Tax=Acinetobacter courvalinii TaxID=280147 RepID=UPI0037CB8B14